MNNVFDLDGPIGFWKWLAGVVVIFAGAAAVFFGWAFAGHGIAALNTNGGMWLTVGWVASLALTWKLARRN
jgi:hypothetical protein